MVINRGFIFDRDGVLNHLVKDNSTFRPTWSLEELEIDAENTDLVVYLREKNYKLFVVSNQPDVKRGGLTITNLNYINNEIDKVFNFDEIVVDTTDDVNFKKPNPYMINKLIEQNSLNRKKTWLIGDRWVDILAAKNANINSILLKKEYSFNATSLGSPPDNLKADVTVKKINEIISLDFL